MLASYALLSGCGDEDGGGGGGGNACPLPNQAFEDGDETGHADVFGAKAAGQARAGRVADAASIVQPAHGRQRVRVGDYALANDKVAFYIEGTGISDGYARGGGEILSVDRVGDDGKPIGQSYYVETLMALGIEMINAQHVTVVNDGSDGTAAIVRVTGPLEPIPFLNGALSALFPRRYDVQAAYEYVLEPGAETLLIRVGLKNPSEDPIQIAFDTVSDEMHGFFQLNMNQFATEPFGFGPAKGDLPWAGFVNPGTSFAWRTASKSPLKFGVEISGFVYTLGPGFVVDGCSTAWRDHAEVVVGGHEYDGLREALRRVDGEAAWSEVTGTVKDSQGAAVPNALVHLVDDAGKYLSRTRADENGKYTIHVPPNGSAKLVPQDKGYPLGAGIAVGAGDATKDVTFEATGAIKVSVTDATTSQKLPARVQVVPTTPGASSPASYGVEDERDDRIHQAFITGSGTITLPVPAGEHRVIVSRGYEYELSDQTVTVGAGETLDLPITLEHSVDSTGVMCADFHIHSMFSADSNDPVDAKVASAVADGLEIPVSSEHEWVIDFQPIVEKLGLADYAFGMPSEELTTFTWGHFGVVPLFPKPDELNNGAVEWIGRMPPAMFDDVQSRPENPVFIVNHPSGGDFSAYFSQSLFDRSTGAGKDKELWSTNFDAVEVFNDSDLESNRKKSFADWMALLNAGVKVMAVGSSDSHHIRSSPVGYPRTCIAFGHDDPTKLTANTVRDAIGTGNTVISGGLSMTVEGPSGEKPGDTVSGAGASILLTVTVRAPSWVDATELEVIVDGETQTTEPLAPLGTGTGKTFVNQVTVNLDTSKESFVIVHAKGEKELAPLHPGRRPFAVSNPMFFKP
ncbi:MAG: CehA/McbA family metallohydrolase [Polyangiaceae bacterium]